MLSWEHMQHHCVHGQQDRERAQQSPQIGDRTQSHGTHTERKGCHTDADARFWSYFRLGSAKEGA